LTGQTPLTPSSRGPLGQYLWDLRQATGMTLREVETSSEGKVSNGYLSQLETGVVKSASPGILYELAAVYEVRLPKNAPLACSYERMMLLAGHIRKPAAGSTTRKSRLPTFATEKLSADEEEEMLKYLAFLRLRKGLR
jgi:transcriptional regulator with XRE-family HTH domain